ncbi:hypothetical protein A3K02_00715 [candidate division WS6 bacterium RIFOXYD1_FULL_33_8]|uniref:Uncharacterized protein n=2 Tax=Candidatus Dojkabacteria TaxID=74243 RepID=A0A0G0CWE0_9BACT|nr:MAG: hypothetical protein UR32_C0012G0015 [candidate division WS6 bacterium GW2011_GWE2_33_157]KKP43912.1 MAG: hypothetical protein UR34_C0009G0013 [candidate division WS6 bacterium GW2011_GWC1_33_20]KKP45902.1 MAG: hypothetical protein UR36_C0003G0057 [candidate division WS6 bacterium GW2011_GWF1_33_233]KKP54308.1 MAG: hypothetical protein UR45_C0019G0013 [candidate division WS6 bacterium GW2011_WS6_33_547]KKP55360.1 MAG: hypothetical protein UR47_C0002G0077 [candidate division WS6 bacteriu
MDNIYTDLFLNTWQPVINIGDIFKIPLILILVAVLFYAFMLTLKVRILSDTIDSEGNSKMKTLVYINLLTCIIASILGTIIILLG